MPTIRQTTIPGLPVTTSLDGTELVPISQAGVTRATTANDIATLAGALGITGPQGPAGPQGIQGPAGVDGVDGATGPQGPAGSGVTYRGDWNSATAYVMSDLVSYGGSGWIAKADNTNVIPAENASWTLFVQQGATGPQGPQGIQGVAGADGAAGANGTSATVSVGTVTTGAAGSSVIINNSGTTSAAVLDFTIPKGDTGSGGVDATYVDTGDATTLADAKAYADSVGGGSGTYATSGGTKPELAPAFGAWTLSGTTPPTQDSSTIYFSAASNIAAAAATVSLKDNQSYDLSYTVAGYAAGSVRVLIYGATTAHSASTPSVSANGTYTYTLTTAGAGTLANQIRIQATGTGGTTLNITNISLRESGGGGLTRPANDKLKEIETSIIDYGADPTGVNDSTSAFNQALASGAKRIHVPAGTYKVTNLVIDKSVEIFGDGRSNSVINITTTTTHGVDLIGEGTSAPGERVMIIRDLKISYVGTGQRAGAQGVWVRRKVFMTNVFVRGFTNNGIYFSPWDATDATNATGTKGTIAHAVFFSRFDNVWSKWNGQDGIQIRMGANANTFVNCDLAYNGRYGFHHVSDGLDDAGKNGSTYGNTIIAGQASYNKNVGYYFESGTNITTMGLYAELNCTPDNTSANGYTNTAALGYNSTSSPVSPYDFWVSDSCQRSWIGIGVLFNSSVIHVRLPTSSPGTIQIWEGGMKRYGNT